MYLPKSQYCLKSIEELWTFNLKVSGREQDKNKIERITNTLFNQTTKVVVTSFGAIYSTLGVNLEKGDLLFFGRKATLEKKQRVTHVGIWLGNDKMEFIHASGNVHLNSMDSNQSNYDEFNRNRYIGSKRYLGVVDEKIINLKKKIKL